MDEDRRKLMGERIEVARERKAYTQAKLAQELGLTETDVQKIEQGDFPSKLFLILEITHVLECSIDYLLGDEPEELSGEEADLLRAYRSLPPGLPRDYVLSFIKSWAGHRSFSRRPDGLEERLERSD